MMTYPSVDAKEITFVRKEPLTDIISKILKITVNICFHLLIILQVNIVWKEIGIIVR